MGEMNLIFYLYYNHSPIAKYTESNAAKIKYFSELVYLEIQILRTGEE